MGVRRGARTQYVSTQLRYGWWHAWYEQHGWRNGWYGWSHAWDGGYACGGRNAWHEHGSHGQSHARNGRCDAWNAWYVCRHANQPDHRYGWYVRWLWHGRDEWSHAWWQHALYACWNARHGWSNVRNG